MPITEPESPAVPLVTKSHTYRPLPRDQRPQDHLGDGRGWTFRTMEHGGESPDMMPQSIVASDAQGRSRVYVPVREDGKVVDSISFAVREQDAQAPPLRRTPVGCIERAKHIGQRRPAPWSAGDVQHKARR